MPIEKISNEELSSIQTKDELKEHLKNQEIRLDIMKKSNTDLEQLNKTIVIDAMKDIATHSNNLWWIDFGTIYLYARTVKNIEDNQLQGWPQQLKSILYTFMKENGIAIPKEAIETTKGLKTNQILYNLNNYAGWLQQHNIRNILSSTLPEEKKELIEAMNNKYNIEEFLEKTLSTTGSMYNNSIIQRWEKRIATIHTYLSALGFNSEFKRPFNEMSNALSKYYESKVKEKDQILRKNPIEISELRNTLDSYYGKMALGQMSIKKEVPQNLTFISEQEMKDIRITDIKEQDKSMIYLYAKTHNIPSYDTDKILIDYTLEHIQEKSVSTDELINMIKNKKFRNMLQKTSYENIIKLKPLSNNIKTILDQEKNQTGKIDKNIIPQLIFLFVVLEHNVKPNEFIFDKYFPQALFEAYPDASKIEELCNREKLLREKIVNIAVWKKWVPYQQYYRLKNPEQGREYGLDCATLVAKSMKDAGFDISGFTSRTAAGTNVSTLYNYLVTKKWYTTYYYPQDKDKIEKGDIFFKPNLGHTGIIQNTDNPDNVITIEATDRWRRVEPVNLKAHGSVMLFVKPNYSQLIKETEDKQMTAKQALPKQS